MSFNRIDSIDSHTSDHFKSFHMTPKRFYVEHKGGNREAIYYPYLIELNSLKREEISDYEKKSILASGLVKTS